MLLLEFSCCRLSSAQSTEQIEGSHLVGVLLNEEVECVAFELAAKELWSRGYVVLQVRSVSRCQQRDCRASDLLCGLWDQAELNGISVLVTEFSVRFGGSTIRGHAQKQEEASTEGVNAAFSAESMSVDDHSLV